MFKLDKIQISNADVLPIIEGGKGINVSTGLTAGTFAKCGAVGTISGTNPDFLDSEGNVLRYIFDEAMTRKEKFQRLVEYSIAGGIDQAKIAYDVASGHGRIHMNFLWEAGGTSHIIDEVLSGVKGLIHGITCGAGLPYSLSDIAAKHKVYYYPIISSARAFKILWLRSYHKVAELLGGVVYEDPWLAGGHNGLSSKEDPKIPQDPYARIVDLRTSLNALNLAHVPIIMAGGVWNLKEWEKYINNKEVGLLAFQFGTRPLLTKESPISDAYKQTLLNVDDGGISLHNFSPTGFYSSAVRNPFLIKLEERSSTQIKVSRKANEDFTKQIPSGNGITSFYVKDEDYARAMGYIAEGLNTLLKTPDDTVIFVKQADADQIRKDQVGCMGCLSHCRFSGWCDKEEKNNTTGTLPDPRSFCIEKTLQDVGHGGSVKDNLVFSGHHAYRFKNDVMYKNGYIPSIQELVNAIMKGD